jgi:hypothetical protein
MRKHKPNPLIEKRLKKIKYCTGSMQYYPKQANLPHPMRIRPIPIRWSWKSKFQCANINSIQKSKKASKRWKIALAAFNIIPSKQICHTPIGFSQFRPDKVKKSEIPMRKHKLNP